MKIVGRNFPYEGSKDPRSSAGIAELLARPEVELVHLRNVGYGCYNFSVRATG